MFDLSHLVTDFTTWTLITASYYLYTKGREYINRKPIDNYFYKVVFFPDKGLLQKQGSKNCDRTRSYDKNSYRSQSAINKNSTSFIHLLNVIRNAKNNLNICLLILSSVELEEAIIDAKRRGVKIRIMVDRDMADVDGSCIPEIQKANIPVLRGPSCMMLHHKFLIADICNDKTAKPSLNTILATGSFNWTWSAVTSNYENLIITDNPQIVGPFVEEFEHLWSHLLNSTNFGKGKP